MMYIDIETNEFPLYIGDLMLRTGLPAEQAVLLPRYQVVESPDAPFTTVEERCVVHPVVFDGTRWYRNITKRPETEEERQRRLADVQQMSPSAGLSSTPGTAPDVIG